MIQLSQTVTTKAIFWTCFALLLTGLALPKTASALVYKTPTGTLKDNCVFWHEGTFYLFTMYQEQIPSGPNAGRSYWNNIWLATSTDGVHWKGVGPVVHNAPFTIFAMRVWKAGNKFILDHGSFTGDHQDVLKFWQSEDLIHWKYLGEDYDVHRPDGGRLDHMDVLRVGDGSAAQWFGYAVGGRLRSEDGIKWTWMEDFRMADRNWTVGETAGIERFGNKYYLLGGNMVGEGPNSKGLPGDTNYEVLTFVADDPAGPFRPDYPAFRLHGNSGIRAVAVFASFTRMPGQVLLANYITDPHKNGKPWWHAPLKTAVVDQEGHLRMGYWSGNEAIKGAIIPLQPGNCSQVFPASTADTTAAKVTLAKTSVEIRLSAPGRESERWLSYTNPQTALVLLREQFDPLVGFVLEGRIKVTPLVDGRPCIGLYFEEQAQRGTAVLLHTSRLTEIGPMQLTSEPHFECVDRTAFGSATVAGIQSGRVCSFRLLFRQDIFELYLDDLLVQTYHTDGATGRMGFLVRDGQAIISGLKAWKMNLDQ